MTNEKHLKQKSEQRAKEARVADALRQNLLKRKQQAQQRQAANLETNT